MNEYTNLNDYTLLNNGEKKSIIFYPEFAITQRRLESPVDSLKINFDFNPAKKENYYIVYASLINKDGDLLYNSYTMFLKELEPNRYGIYSNIEDDSLEEETIIDFNTLDYPSFIRILPENEELAKMIPALKKALEEDIKAMSEEKEITETIDIVNPLNYYQNVNGNLINIIEQVVTTEEEAAFSNRILKNLKKNYEVILNDQSQNTLLNLTYASMLYKKSKSINLKPTQILETKDLKLDTNKSNVSKQDLDKIFRSIINKLKRGETLPDDLNIIQERIAYIIESKPRLKEINNFIKIILADEKYLSSNKRVRTVEEDTLKELLLDCLSNCNYYPLPRNEVIVYNESNDNIDFLCIISVDLIQKLLNTYKINKNTDKKFCDQLTTLKKMIDGNKIPTKEYISILVNLLVIANVYYAKNVNKDNILFEKGEYIIHLDYKEGDYDITVMNSKTEKKYGTINRLEKDYRREIKEALNKGEKQFNQLINDLIYKNILACLHEQNLEVKITDISHAGIKVVFGRTLDENCFVGTFPLDALITILTSVKIPKTRKQEAKVEEEEEKPKHVRLKATEKDYIIRKAFTISDIMSKTPIDNENYKEIAKLYAKYQKEPQDEILFEIQKLF